MNNNLVGRIATEAGIKIAASVATNVIDEVNTVTTTVGTFIFKMIRDRIARTVSFTVGDFENDWMESSLYAILYRYNDIKKQSTLQMTTMSTNTRDLPYYRLGDGSHHLKYRNYDIILFIKSKPNVNTYRGSASTSYEYTVATFNTSDKFVEQFERDMINSRDSLLRFKTNSSYVNVYKDTPYSDEAGLYWGNGISIPRRTLSSIYLPREVKVLIVNTVNRFFSDKEYYKKHGIPHNLKIVLYGPPAGGKDSIARMIASEWYRNIYYVTGNSAKLIPNAITSQSVYNPLFLISDIDKYPYLINEDSPLGNKTDEDHLEDNKRLFGAMINALDGVTSGEDRIIVMTTNHIEKFSPTFLRPGRIDLKLEIKLVSLEAFRMFVKDYYGKILPNDTKLKSDTITIADMQADVVFLRMPFEEFCSKYLDR